MQAARSFWLTLHDSLSLSLPLQHLYKQIIFQRIFNMHRMRWNRENNAAFSVGYNMGVRGETTTEKHETKMTRHSTYSACSMMLKAIRWCLFEFNVCIFWFNYCGSWCWTNFPISLSPRHTSHSTILFKFHLLRSVLCLPSAWVHFHFHCRCD